MSGNNDSRIMVFIDLANVVKGAKETAGFRAEIDILSLVDEVVDGRICTGVYVYDSKMTSDNEYARLQRDAESVGYDLVLSDPSYDKETGKLIQKEVDNNLCLDILDYAYKNLYDTAIIVSGDRDFRPAILKVHPLGKNVEVASFKDCASYVMKCESDVYVNLADLPVISLSSDIVSVDDYEPFNEIVTAEATANVY